MRRISLLTWILWLLALALSLLPMTQALNDLGALLAMWMGLDRLLMKIAPLAARYVAAILHHIFGVPTSIYGASIYLEGGGIPIEVKLDWNCLGWQGALMMALALIILLQGEYTMWSKVKTALLGAEVFIAANTARMILPCLLLTHLGYGPALLFHNYLATPMILAVIALYWHLSMEFILQPREGAEGGVRLRDVLLGRRGISVATMAILLLATLYTGLGILPVEAVDCPRTALTFEFAEPDFRYLTHPDWTYLGERPHTDEWKNTGIPGWYKLWEFDLYGPLVEDYRMRGNINYYVYFYCSRPHKAPYEFHIYDVDPSADTSPVEVHVDRFIIPLEAGSPPDPIKLKGEGVRPYIFKKGHTIRITIYVYDDGHGKRVYYFDYDSKDKHSYADFPGIVVDERLLPSIPLAIAALMMGVRRRNGGEGGL